MSAREKKYRVTVKGTTVSRHHAEDLANRAASKLIRAGVARVDVKPIRRSS